MRPLLLTSSNNHTRTTQIGIVTSLAVHLLLLFIIGWWMGAGTAARKLVQAAKKAIEQPKVTMLFPKQIEEVAPKPKAPQQTVTLGAPTQQYVRSSSTAPSAPVAPAKADFVSDKTTVAAASMAPFPDATAPLPTQLRSQQPAISIAPPKPAAPQPVAATPTVSPLLPQEPMTVPTATAKPEQVAKADAALLKTITQQMDDNSARIDTTRLPLQIKKAAAANATPPTPRMVEPQTPSPEPLPTITKAALPTTPARVRGSVSNRGSDAANAVASPIGKYEILVEAAFGEQWEKQRAQHAKELPPGSLRLNFYLSANGKQEEAQVIDNQGSPLMEKLALEAWQQTVYPPFPEDLIKDGNDRLEFTHHVIIIP